MKKRIVTKLLAGMIVATMIGGPVVQAAEPTTNESATAEESQATTVADAKEALEKAESAEAAARKEKEQAQADLKDAQAKYEAAKEKEQAAKEVVEDMKNVTEEAIAEAEKVVEDAKTVVAEKETAVNEAEKSIEDAKNVVAEKETAYDAIKDTATDEKIAAAKKDVETAKKELQAKEKEAEEANKEIAEVKKQVKALEDEKEKLNEVLKAIDDYEAAGEERQAALDEYEAEPINKEHDAIVEALNNADEKVNSNAKYQKLKRDLDNALNEANEEWWSAETEKEKEAVRKKQKAAQDAFDKGYKELLASDPEFAADVAERDRLEKESIELLDQINELYETKYAERVNAADEKEANAIRTADRILSEFGDEGGISSAIMNQGNYEAKVAELQDKIDGIEIPESEYDEEIALLKDAVKEAQGVVSELEEAKKEVDAAKKAVDDAKDAVIAAEAAKEKAEKAVEDAKKELEKAEEKLNILKEAMNSDIKKELVENPELQEAIDNSDAEALKAYVEQNPDSALADVLKQIIEAIECKEVAADRVEEAKAILEAATETHKVTEAALIVAQTEYDKLVKENETQEEEEKAPEKNETAKTEVADTVKTGDPASMSVFAELLGSIALAGAAIKIRRRK